MARSKLWILLVLLAAAVAVAYSLLEESAEDHEPPAKPKKQATTGNRSPPKRGSLPAPYPSPPFSPWPYISWAARSPYSFLARAAVEAGGSFDDARGDELLRFAMRKLGDGEYVDEDLAIRAFYVLAGKKRRDLVGRIQSLCKESMDDWGVARWAVRALERIRTDRAVAALASFAGDDDAGVRRQAAAALGRRGGPTASKALAGMVTDADDTVAAAAAGALSALGAPAGKADVRAALGKQDGAVDAALALGLGREGAVSGIPVLNTILSRRDPQARIAAAAALGRIGGEGAESRLRALLLDEDASVRLAAATALFDREPSEAARSAIQEGVRDGKLPHSARNAALESLARHGTAKDVAFLQKTFDVDVDDEGSRIGRVWAAHGLIRLGGK